MNILTIYLIAIGILMFAVIVAIIIYNKTFKNRAFIARQTGKDTSNVIWIQDKFKVVMKDGHYFIKFKNLRQKTTAVNGAYWTAFFRPKDSAKELKVTKEEWEHKEFGKKIQRGLFFYETNDGEFYPMKIEMEAGSAEFKILSHDNRRWIANQIKDIHDLTRNRTKDILLLVAGIIAIAVIGVVFIFGSIYMNEQATKSLAVNQVACTAYIDKLMNYTTTLKNEKGTAQTIATNFVGG